MAIEDSAREFWRWFEQNQDMVFHFERDQEAIFDRLQERLVALHPALAFEFSPIIDGRREFIISAGGYREGFPAVEALVATAPALPRWIVIGFRPRRHPIMPVTLGGKTVSPDSVEATLLSNGQMLGVRLFFRGYVEEEREVWLQIGYLLLDEALGEYDVEAKLGLVEFMPFELHPDAARVSLPELPGWFDDEFAALRQ